MGLKEKICIVGASLMGCRLALVMAVHGHPVRITDASVVVDETKLIRLREKLNDLELDVSAARFVLMVRDLEEAARGGDVVFEVGPEDLESKRTIFMQLGLLAPRTALVASVNSTIPVSQIVAGMAIAERVVGTHWPDAPFVGQIVEVSRAKATNDAAIETMSRLLKSVGMTPSLVARAPGL